MKIAVKDHAKFSLDKMAKIALATTDRAQLDLYCVAPGQSQKPHTPRRPGQDLLRARGQRAASRSAAQQERLAAGEALVAPAGVEHGLVNDGTEPLLVLVVVTPPPPHAKSALARMIRERAWRDRAGDAAGAGGMGPSEPFPAPRDDDTAAKEWERLQRVTGTESAVVRGPIPPAPAASPVRRRPWSVRESCGLAA